MERLTEKGFNFTTSVKQEFDSHYIMQCMKKLQKYEDLEDDSHVLHLWEPFDVNIDENYKFVEDGFLFSFLSHLIYVIGFPILFIIQKLFLKHQKF